MRINCSVALTPQRVILMYSTLRVVRISESIVDFVVAPFRCIDSDIIPVLGRM